MRDSRIEKASFGVTAEGMTVDRYVLRNGQGVSLSLITFGATITELWVPDRYGRRADIVLGFDNLAQYEAESPYFGCTVGRVAFRIVGGEFTLDGKTYRLALNNGSHHLHGGTRGFSKVVWTADASESAHEASVRLDLFSPDGDQGYPGNLRVTAVHTLTDENELRIDYTATTDRPTPINLTHHGYFNLAGACGEKVLDHVLWLDADRFTPTDATLSPTGEIVSVKDTPLDFTQPQAIGARMSEQAGMPDGYDLAYLRRDPEGGMAVIARVEEPTSGRIMEVSSNEPAIVLYTGNYLDGTIRGKRNVAYDRHAGLCLEPGRLPDAVHHDHFAPMILEPGQVYSHRCSYRFSRNAP